MIDHFANWKSIFESNPRLAWEYFQRYSVPQQPGEQAGLEYRDFIQQIMKYFGGADQYGKNDTMNNWINWSQQGGFLPINQQEYDYITQLGSGGTSGRDAYHTGTAGSIPMAPPVRETPNPYSAAMSAPTQSINGAFPTTSTIAPPVRTTSTPGYGVPVINRETRNTPIGQLNSPTTPVSTVQNHMMRPPPRGPRTY